MIFDFDLESLLWQFFVILILNQFLGDFDLILCLFCAKITLTLKYALLWCNIAGLLSKWIDSKNRSTKTFTTSSQQEQQQQNIK